MPVFLLNILGPIIAQMGLMLLSERVVRRVTVLTLRALEGSLKKSYPHISDVIDVVADALEVPEPVKNGVV